MAPYTIQVFYAGRPDPAATSHVGEAGGVLDMISRLLCEHQDCQCVRVYAGVLQLASVDREGSTAIS